MTKSFPAPCETPGGNGNGNCDGINTPLADEILELQIALGIEGWGAAEPPAHVDTIIESLVQRFERDKR